MESSSRKSDSSPRLLNLIPNSKEWLMMNNNGGNKSHESVSEEKKLELRLAPPGSDSWSTQQNKEMKTHHQKSLLSLGYTGGSNGGGGGGFPFVHHQFPNNTTPLAHHPTTVMGKESSQHCCGSKVGVLELQQSSSAVAAAAEKKKALLSSSPAPPPAKTTAVPNTSQKRTAPAPVVGWPPIRSFRKNLASTSASKQATESQNLAPKPEKPVDESSKRGLFVKINMDGVPIGRKVDLKAYDSYEKLATAVDQLFRGLLAAQRDSGDGQMKEAEEEKAITGVLDGSGEYTLVYEDNEGDRMLVGDVPWHMFVSMVKRLRVLKSSDVSSLTLGSNKQDKIPS